MSELTITALRLGYLGLLWVFVVFAIAVLRSDIYGTRVLPRRNKRAATAAPAEPAPARPGVPAKPVAPKRSSGPTHLAVTEGNLQGVSLPLTSQPVTLGRAPNSTLVLEDDFSSGRHARIFQDQDHWLLEDLNSTNGTYLNGNKINGVKSLSSGDRIRIGRTVIEVRR